MLMILLIFLSYWQDITLSFRLHSPSMINYSNRFTDRGSRVELFERANRLSMMKKWSLFAGRLGAKRRRVGFIIKGEVDEDRVSADSCGEKSIRENYQPEGRVPLVIPCDTPIPILYPNLTVCCKERDKQQTKNLQTQAMTLIKEVKAELLDLLTPRSHHTISEHWQSLTTPQHIHIHSLIHTLQSLQMISKTSSAVQSKDFLAMFVLTGNWQKIYTNVRLSGIKAFDHLQEETRIPLDSSSDSVPRTENRFGNLVFNISQTLIHNPIATDVITPVNKREETSRIDKMPILSTKESICFEYQDPDVSQHSSGAGSSHLKGKLVIDSQVDLNDYGRQQIHVQEYSLIMEDERSIVDERFVHSLQRAIPLDSFDPDDCVSELLVSQTLCINVDMSTLAFIPLLLVCR
jgi:hypothetical protein